MRPGSSGHCRGEGGRVAGACSGARRWAQGLVFHLGCERAAARLRCLPRQPLHLSHGRGRQHAWKTPKCCSGTSPAPWATSTTRGWEGKLRHGRAGRDEPRLSWLAVVIHTGIHSIGLPGEGKCFFPSPLPSPRARGSVSPVSPVRCRAKRLCNRWKMHKSPGQGCRRVPGSHSWIQPLA